MVRSLNENRNNISPTVEAKTARRRKGKQFLDGHSRAIQNVCTLIEHVAHTNANVLILGESGTGKELVARGVHTTSERSSKPFVPVNCAAIPSELLESELFGHEKGAFTGAVTARKGRFELAEGGTLFLDEIGDMDLHMQAKLLRVLQERCFERVGGTQTISSNVRVIAATHRELESMVSSGDFREDLYYRLNVFPIDLPPLRRRAEDIPALIYAITEKLKKEQGVRFSLTNDALKTLSNYHWPGNVRELSNLIERLSILYPDDAIDTTKLPMNVLGDQDANSKYIAEKNNSVMFDQGLTVASGGDVQEAGSERILDELTASGLGMPSLPIDGIDLKEHITQMEIHFIREALERSDGVVARAAGLLGLRRTTLVEKLRKYEIQR